jgi:hypothetical protein
VPGHITQLTASLGQSYYFVIIVKSYRGYSDACIYLEKILNFQNSNCHKISSSALRRDKGKTKM